jgi:hypothetical protein
MGQCVPMRFKKFNEWLVRGTSECLTIHRDGAAFWLLHDRSSSGWSQAARQQQDGPGLAIGSMLPPPVDRETVAMAPKPMPGITQVIPEGTDNSGPLSEKAEFEGEQNKQYKPKPWQR